MEENARLIVKTCIKKLIFITNGSIREVTLEPNLKHCYKNVTVYATSGFLNMPSESTIKNLSENVRSNQSLCQECLKCGPKTGKMVILLFAPHFFVCVGIHVFVYMFSVWMGTCVCVHIHTYVHMIETEHNQYIRNNLKKEPLSFHKEEHLSIQKMVNRLVSAMKKTVLYFK